MKELMKQISIPEEAMEGTLKIYDKITSDKSLWEYFNGKISEFLKIGGDFPMEDFAREIGEKINENHFAVHLVILLESARRIKPLYDERGISEEIYYDTMRDLSYKVKECKKHYDVYGIKSFVWFFRLMVLNTFMLGRLEYAEETADFDYKDYIKKGDTIYGCHIPSSGPLTYDSVMDSLKRAYKFFGCEKYLAVFCSSWMLYPPLYREVFPEGSNLRMFYELFDMIDEKHTGNNSNLWRIFYKDEDTPLDELPQETTLQRNFVKYFREGKFMGSGKGVIIFDGEKIVNK